LKSDSLAKALREAAPDIVNKFFSNMSANASAVLKEEMEYGRPLTQEEIREEREKIINLIKQLENEGKIFIREKPKGLLLEGAEAVKETPDFDEYLNAGARYYEAGQYSEAVPYFEYCAQMDPGNAPVYQYLGGTYYALGMTAEAVEAYRKALELDPSNEELKAWLSTQASK
jgi:tetratricopeptide (TPR) repeat protein